MSNVTKGPKLGKLINANEGDNYSDALREFLRACDQHIMPTVLSTWATVPPTTPQNGDAYIVGPSGSGAWATHSDHIAVWSTEITMPGANTKVPGWEFHVPGEGWNVWDASLQQSQRYTNGNWTTAQYGHADEEIPQGAVNGVNSVFTIARMPNPTSSFKLYSGGIRLIRGADLTGTADYMLEGVTVTYKTAPVTNTFHCADYRY